MAADHRQYAGDVSFAVTDVVAPSPGLIVWTALVGLLLVAGAVTAAKGRWGWVLVGLLTGGLPWIVTAFLHASPDSLWRRTFKPAGS
ncbi:MAG: hypothetical protein QOJ35_3276 [Solirubrobacteraceae bacterium]|jgi:hypothetical protein|nr:hypothetical protein [Solirubrobacteraceae bacterium]